MTNDFIEYWAAARLLLNHGNAYSPTELLQLQRSVGWTQAMPLLMWNPPWTLPLILPFGLLNHDTAQSLWFLLHSVIIFLGAQLLWRLYGATPSPSRVGWLALLTFAPIYFVLLLGQIAPLILAGLIGFLLTLRKRAWFWSGACLAVASIKPHLLYLVWLSALLWIWRERKWQIAGGFLAVFALMAGVPLLFDGQVYARYLTLMSDRTVVQPLDWATPTIGTAVNALFGSNSLWLRWLAAFGGMLWLLRYWRKNATQWNWSVDLPLILLASVATAPFSWTFDYVILLPALMQGSVWLGAVVKRQRVRGFSAIYLALCSILLFGKILVRNDFWYFWLAPAFLILYIWLREDGKAMGTQPNTVAQQL